MDLNQINLSVMKKRPYQWLVVLLLSVVVLAALLMMRSVTGIIHAETGIQQLKDGYFSLAAPVVISHHPLVRVERGKVKFHSASQAKKDVQISGLLPSAWTDFFTAEKLENLQLEDAKFVIDYRKTSTDSPKGQGLQNVSVAQALKNSALQNLNIQNSTLKILRDYQKPVKAFIKSARFEVDLNDSELEGAGLMDIKGEETRFAVQYNFARQNEAGVVLGDVVFSLENTLCNGEFRGVMEGRPKLHLLGDVQFQVTDSTRFGRWVAETEIENENQKHEKQPESPSSKSVKHKPLSVSGKFSWAGEEGALSGAELIFGKSTGTGNLALKTGQANPEISGTLAFQTLDFSDLISFSVSDSDKQPMLDKPHFNKMVDEKKIAVAQKNPFKKELRQGIELGVKQIYGLVQNLDADLRISASSIQLGEFEMTETGFSVFQKQGEFILDMAGVTIFNGQVTGLFKFDTNFPKPRWHINSNFTGVNFAEISKAFHLPPVIESIGDYRFHITSFGDKPDEIFANVSGAFTLEAENGGQIAIKLSELLREQKLGSGEQISQLTSDKSAFSALLIKGHFAKGAVIADHFSVRADAHEFTGNGVINLEKEKLKLHVGAWDISGLITEEKENEERQNPEMKEPAPELLTCSHLTGAWDTPYFEKFTAAHLKSLDRTCTVRFRYVPLKTKDDPIVPLKNAG